MSGVDYLRIEDLHTSFKTGRGIVRAVDGVTLSLARGESLGIVGESGSGKTVLARSIMGSFHLGQLDEQAKSSSTVKS